jgi:hypothetical protein
MESIGFKEWALVCEALGRGEQTVILRKGGIAEGADGFAFQHRDFFLFPTFFHEQIARVRTPTPELPAAFPGDVEIRFAAQVEAATFVADWETVAALEALHVLAADVVRERFAYDETHGIHAAFVRVSRLSTPWRFPDERRYRGCRSWLKLPAFPDDTTLTAVISDARHEQQLARFREITGATRTLSNVPA